MQKAKLYSNRILYCRCCFFFFFPSSHPASALLSLSGMVVICLEGIQLQHFVSREYYRSAKMCPVAYLGAKLGAA